MTVNLALMFLFLGLSAFFSSSETAFFSLEKTRVETMLREGKSGAARVSSLLAQPTRLLSSVLLGNNLVNTAAAAIGTLIAAEIAPGGLAVVAATISVTLLLVLFGEIGPKTVALQHNWAVARLYATPLTLWGRFARPLVAGLDLLSRLWLSLVGGRGESSPASLTLGDLRTAISLGEEEGHVEAQTSTVMLGALQLPERRIESVMVHRTNMVAVGVTESVRTAIQRLHEHGYLRMPVVDGDGDNVVGSVHLSDLSSAATEDALNKPVGDLMRAPWFEPESASIGHVLESMKSTGGQMAIVVDEIGALAGIVTLEDIIEELVGEIHSETGFEPPAETPASRGQSITVPAASSLDALAVDLGMDLSQVSAMTVGGLVLTELKRMARRGDSVIVANHRFTVSNADARRVVEVTIDPIEHPQHDVPEVTTE